VVGSRKLREGEKSVQKKRSKIKQRKKVVGKGKKSRQQPFKRRHLEREQSETDKWGFRNQARKSKE